MRFHFGQRVRDVLTNFEGVVVSQIVFLNECVQWAVQPTELKDGQPCDPITLEDARIEAINDAPMHVFVVPEYPNLLGKEVFDVVSGVTGIAYAQSRWAYGTCRIAIAPKGVQIRTGAPKEISWIDVQQIEVIPSKKPIKWIPEMFEEPPKLTALKQIGTGGFGREPAISRRGA